MLLVKRRFLGEITAKTLGHLLLAALMGPLWLLGSLGLAAEIRVVGSSTVYPFVSVGAERFGQLHDTDAPRIESTGTGGGLKLFCAGAGAGTPDIAGASRRIKSSELASCVANGAGPILEVRIGYDGIVFAQNRAGVPIAVTRTEMFLALARDLPDKSRSPSC